MPNDSLQRSVLPIPDREPVGLTTYSATDPNTKFPPTTPLRPPACVDSSQIRSAAAAANRPRRATKCRARRCFDGRQRPKGLEVPACDACNQATKKHEQAYCQRSRSDPSASLKRGNKRSALPRSISCSNARGSFSPGSWSTVDSMGSGA